MEQPGVGGAEAGAPDGCVARSDVLAELLEAQRPRLLRLSVLLLDDLAAAEDVLQDVFEAVFLRSDPLPDSLEAYLTTAVANRSRSVLRRRKTRALGLARLLSRTPTSTPDLAEIYGDRARVWAAVRRLPSRQREVLILRYWHDLSEQQTADVLGVSIGTVKTCLSRARATLSKTLGERP